MRLTLENNPREVNASNVDLHRRVVQEQFEALGLQPKTKQNKKHLKSKNVQVLTQLTV